MEPDDTPEGIPRAAVDELSGKMDLLLDLFNRRLLDDRDKRRAFDELYARLEAAEKAAAGELFLSVARELFLIVDRIDAAGVPDGGLCASVREELLELLRRRGIEEIPVGAAFDPSLHEMEEVSHTSGAEGGVLMSRRRGFRRDNRVVRPALVRLEASAAGDP